MHDTTVDCRKLPCPQPIIKLRALLETSAPERIQVIVDNEPAVENVRRFLASRGYETACDPASENWRITAARGTKPDEPKAEAAARPRRADTGEGGPKTLVLVVTPVLGSGDDTLGLQLMKNFLATLPEFGEDLWRIILLNGGVTLAAEGSPVLRELQALEASGVSILVCGACLNHFKLLEKKAVGETTNMLDVVTSIQVAEKVVRV